MSIEGKWGLTTTDVAYPEIAYPYEAPSPLVHGGQLSQSRMRSRILSRTGIGDVGANVGKVMKPQ